MKILNLVKSQIYENFGMALATLRAHKLRSFLTVIGIVIGVITVMLISSIISGIDVGVTREIESLGTRSIYISRYSRATSVEERRAQLNRKPLTVQDAEAIAALPSVDVCVPMFDVTYDSQGKKVTVTGPNGKTSSEVRLNGTYPAYERVGTETLTEGRWFIDAESETGQNLAVIGQSVADSFFKFGSPVGQTIDIGGTEFRVIGMLQKREQFVGGGGHGPDRSNAIYMPYSAARRIKSDTKDIRLVATAADETRTAKEDISELLRVRRNDPFDKPDTFGMMTADSMIESFRSVTAGVALIMVLISSVGLLIGGIGVMNIMLVSVAERTREIGVRKAVGAKNRDILLQFLVEAMTLTGFGGLIGLFVGWLATFIVKLLLPSYVPLWAPVAGFFVSVGIGLVFGILPAWKAARLDPIEALRFE